MVPHWIPAFVAMGLEMLFLMKSIADNRHYRIIRAEGADQGQFIYGLRACGSVLLLVDEKPTAVVNKGDCILFNSLIPHTFKNNETSTFRAVWSV